MDDAAMDWTTAKDMIDRMLNRSEKTYPLMQLQLRSQHQAVVAALERIDRLEAVANAARALGARSLDGPTVEKYGAARALDDALASLDGAVRAEEAKQAGARTEVPGYPAIALRKASRAPLPDAPLSDRARAMLDEGLASAKLGEIRPLGDFMKYIDGEADREALAFRVGRLFHEHYERLAPEHGYATRHETRVPWGDLPAALRRLTVATVRAVLGDLGAARGEGERLDGR